MERNVEKGKIVEKSGAELISRYYAKLESGRLHKLFTSPQKAHLHSGQVLSLLIAPPFVVSYKAESYTELRATTA